MIKRAAEEDRIKGVQHQVPFFQKFGGDSSLHAQ